MSQILYKGFVYESVNEKELEFIYDKMAHSLEDLNTVLNTVHDGNQKKAISSLMKKTRETFNEKIKGVDYHPNSIEDMQKTADAVDSDMKEEQMKDEHSSSESNLEQMNATSEKHA